MNSSSGQNPKRKNSHSSSLPLLLMALACCLVIALACEAVVHLVLRGRAGDIEQN